MSNVEEDRQQTPPPSDGEESPAGPDAPPDAAPPRQSWREVADGMARSARDQYARRAAPYVGEATRWARSSATRRAAPPNEISGLAASLWRWAPGLVPLALETLLLLLGISLIGHHVGHGATIARGQVTTLALVLSVLGVALAAALYTARDIGTWTLALLLGVSSSLIATVFVLLGRGAALAAAAILLLAGAAFLRPHRVAENMVLVTTYLGRFHRTLFPGMQVLLPGEQIMATLPTDQRRITTLPPATAALRGEAHATGTLVYQFVPREAHRAALMARDWEAGLQQMLAQALREELQRWHLAPSGTGAAAAQDGKPADDANGGGGDEERLRQRLGARLRRVAPQWGLRVVRVELSDVVIPQDRAQPQASDMSKVGEQLADLYLQSTSSGQRAGHAAPAAQPPSPAGQTMPAPASPHHTTRPLPPRPADNEATVALNESAPALPDAHVSSPGPSQPPRLLSRLAGLAAGWQGEGRRAAQRSAGEEVAQAPSAGPVQSASEGERIAGSGGRAGAGEPSVADAASQLSPEVLATAYEAVREGRIGDPATIRQIADRFAGLAATTESDNELAFDPESAARILRQRAEELALALGDAPEEAATEVEQPPPEASHRAPTPRLERDENVTSGG
jgi:hypothetical protein